MKFTLKTIIPGILLPGILIIASCGNGEKKVSTSADSLPPELAGITKMIEAQPDNASLYNDRAVIYLNRKEPDKALNDATRAVALDSDNPAWYRTLSDVYFMQGKIQKCRETLNKALEKNEKDTESLLKLAELFFYMKDYPKTFEYTQKALDIDKLTAKADFINGMAYKDLGDTAKAVKCFQFAIEKDQEYYHAYMQLGLIFSARHNPLAGDYFNNAIRLNPSSIEAYYALGMFMQEHGEYNKAIEAYTKILALDPKYKTAHYNLGYIHLVHLQVFDVAAKHFTNAIACDPNYTEAYYNRGYCYELMGDVTNARKDYEKALKIRPNYMKAVDGQNRLDKLMR